jgi:hypothetical protein
MSIDEVLQIRRHVAQLQIAAPAELGHNIPRPAFSGVECEDAGRVAVLAIQQVRDGGLKIGRLVIGVAADPAQIDHHQLNVMILATGNDRGCPLGLTHYGNSTPRNRDSRRARGDSFLQANNSALAWVNLA